MTIRQRPGDFRVEEILTSDALGGIVAEPRAHAVYRLRKSGITTPQALAEVARTLRVPPANVRSAGLKDRHAETTQHVTVRFARPGEGPRTIDHRGWRLERAGWTDEPISGAAIAANRFRIVLRNLPERDSQRMDQAADLLRLPHEGHSAAAPALIATNYFGDQRFGSSDGRRGLLGPHLVRGEYEKAVRKLIATPHRKDARALRDERRLLAESWGRWSEVLPKIGRSPQRRAVEHLVSAPDDFRGAFSLLPALTQQMTVEAYQSWLWNSVAAGIVAERCAGRGPMIVADDPWGDLHFPAASAIDPAIRELDLPLLGPKTELREPWAEAVKRVLAEEGIAVSELQLPGLRRPWFAESGRPLFVRASTFVLGPSAPDEGTVGRPGLMRTVAFELPRGAYATVVLRALGQ